MRPPQVSVALVTWNGAAHLEAQLLSLLAQTHRSVELVVSDDASTDRTWALLEAWAPRFADRGIAVELLRNGRNLGLQGNMERALRACRGDWIAPCDQDDVWRADKLERLLGASKDATLVYSDSELIDAKGRSMGSRVSDRLTMVQGSDPRVFALGNCVSGHAALFRRSLLERALPLPAVAYYDWWLAFVAATDGRIRYVEEPLVAFRQHASNASRFTGRAGGPRPGARDKQAASQRDLDALASVSGRHQPFFAELAMRWRERSGRRLTPRLAAFLWTHRSAVFAMKKRVPGGSRHALKYLLGPGWRR